MGLLLALNGARNGAFRRWLDGVREEPRIAWYPSAYGDFRDHGRRATNPRHAGLRRARRLRPRGPAPRSRRTELRLRLRPRHARGRDLAGHPVVRARGRRTPLREPTARRSRGRRGRRGPRRADPRSARGRGRRLRRLRPGAGAGRGRGAAERAELRARRRAPLRHPRRARRRQAHALRGLRGRSCGGRRSPARRPGLRRALQDPVTPTTTKAPRCSR